MKTTLVAVYIAVLFSLLACTTSPGAKESAQIIVFGAASSFDVLRDAGKRFEAQTGIHVAFSFDSSSNLVKQIKAGSPADVFLSADQKWMDDVVAAGAVRKETIQVLLGNSLVMIAPVDKRFDVQLSKDINFVTRLPEIERIAMGDPAHVPAGRYARQALESLGWWTELEPRIIPALDVRAALRLVEIGEADAGVVYATDAKQSDKVVVVAAFPPELHEPIRYPIAQCTDSKPAADFIEFLRRPDMTGVFVKAGFQVHSASEDR